MISKGAVSGAKFTTLDKRLRIRDERETPPGQGAE